MPETVQLSIGPRPGEPTTGARGVHLDLGAQHPSRTGLLLALAELDQECLHAVRIQPGFNHRSAEKLFEVRDYRQVLMLADRHDWQSPFTGELVVTLACEHLMGLVAPERAVWLRTLLAEHARVSSHLAHLSFVPHRLQDMELAHRIRTVRDNGRNLMLAASGNRVHPMLNRLGGLATDIHPALVQEFAAWSETANEVAVQIDAALRNSGLGQGLGAVDATMVKEFGLGGPASVAAGLCHDLRTTGEYLAYGHLGAELARVDHEPAPDAHGRFRVLCEQVAQSRALMVGCANRLEGIGGPVDTKLSKIIKIPDAETWLAIEAPWGPAGVLLVSRAERTPWRLALRTPSFANVQALQHALEGCPLADADVVVASLGWTSGDLDK